MATATVTQGAAHEAVMPVTEPPPTESLHLWGRCSEAKKVELCDRRNQRMITMYLMQNKETIDRLVAQGEFLLKTFHAGYQEEPAGYNTEFLCGKLSGWRNTLHTLYHDCAEEIVDRVVAKTCLAIPDSSRSVGFTRLRHENSREQN